MSELQPTAGYADVNGLHMYYESYGTGAPLLLLHGGAGSIEMFADMLPALATGRRVIGVELQAHARTADIDRPLRYETMADDVAALIRQLDLERADVLGFSLGGGVALRTAIQHPELVNRLVVISAACRRHGWYEEVLAGMASSGPDTAEALKATPMYAIYERLAPRMDDWEVLITRLGELLRREYDWSAEVAALRLPALLVYGDADSVRTSHAVELFELLGGGQRDGGWDGSGRSQASLTILPGRTHYNVIQTPGLATTIAGFLDGSE